MILYCVYVQPEVFSDALAAWPHVQHAECGAGWAVQGGRAAGGRKLCCVRFSG